MASRFLGSLSARSSTRGGGLPIDATFSTPPMRGVSCAAAAVAHTSTARAVDTMRTRMLMNAS